MGLLSIQSLLGVFALLYFSSFLLFAALRITTGISIQRLGLTSLRHVAYTIRDGLRVEIRGLGFVVHKPTFAQPTWVSLRLEDLKIIIDPVAAQRHAQKKAHTQDAGTQDFPSNGGQSTGSSTRSKSKVWRRLTDIKEQLKKIHQKIQWLRMLDVYATGTTLEVAAVGSLTVGSVTLAVHTRRRMLDRGRLFRHKKNPSDAQKPAEWMFTMRSLLLTAQNKDPVEILDLMAINVHGLLYRDKPGLRDTSVAVKIGRLHIPIDDILSFREAMRPPKKQVSTDKQGHVREISVDDYVQELERPGSREAAIVQTVADSKEFFASVLRSVEEVQVGMSFIRASKEVVALRQANLPVIMNVVTHEIGIDLHRVPQASPAHRMYFDKDAVAHQALVAAVSISVSLEEDDSKADRILYIPMATTTVRTTLPSKTMSLATENDPLQRNTNILFANLVVTSPSLDLTPRHLVQLLAIANQREKKPKPTDQSQHRMISRLLPKAIVKFSIHEPVLRFVLPVADHKHRVANDFDMIIAAISSVSLEVESSHSTKTELLYSLAWQFRIVSHHLYYQAASGIKHNLMTLNTLELKAQVSCSDEVYVIITGNLRDFSLLIVRAEVGHGIHSIVRHLMQRRHDRHPDEETHKPHESFLRKLPPWLLEFHFEGHKCSMEVAGIDDTISSQTRGAALELEIWTVDYMAHRPSQETFKSPQRKQSASVRMNESSSKIAHLTPPSTPPQHRHLRSSNTPQGPTDGRRLTTHLKGIQGFIIESMEEWEQKPFLSIPQVEVAFSTSRDHQGPMFHINSHVRALYLEFSLYRIYSVGVAATVAHDAFMGSSAPSRKHPQIPQPQTEPTSPAHKASIIGELLALDIKIGYIQLKAQMPHDPAMMLQVYELVAGRHRWAAPFVRCHLVRLHATSPCIKTAWARIVSVSAIRVDLRQSRKKTPSGNVEEKSIDVMTDFIRLAVPHGMRMFKIFDNFINTAKSMLQLAHRYKTRSNEYILQKEPEKPKHVPRISVRSKALMFELEDDAFEWRLSNIYHCGRNEQKQRMAREDAFKLKVRKMQEERSGRSSSRRRGRSARAASREVSPNDNTRRSQSHDSTPRRRSTSRGRSGKPVKLRYDRDGACSITGDAKVATTDAWEKLQEYNSRSWKTRIDWLRSMQDNAVKSVRRMFSGADAPPPDIDDHETILTIPNRPGILTIIISDLHLVVDAPSFPLNKLPDFMHDVGKGMPKDMQYSLLIPMNLALDMGEARFMLRDYPLNLLHVPAIRPGQPPRLPSWSIRTDFVIAEEFRDEQSIRHVQVEIVPKGQKGQDGQDIPGFAIDVRRTVSPVKTYSMPVIEVNTSAATSITWCTAYQPAIQDAMMVIETFTKPEIDPSDRVGFWDKVRLSFHSRPVVSWKGDGDVQLRLKGSRDPYVVTGHGAGFVMCWRNNVRWAIHETDDPKKFMTVTSGEYVLAVPDYSQTTRPGNDDSTRTDIDSGSSAHSSNKNAATFAKVIMKVSGNVQWTTGLVFERDVSKTERSADFKPHYEVVLKSPKFVSQQELEHYDAFRGFRSQHIHMSVSLVAPNDRDWISPENDASPSYNSVHLSPRFFSHFFAWWHLFGGVSSLPIRQGKLWRGPEKSSKKFGRHLATIKYNLLLSPLFISHIYKHKDSEDYKENVVSATGLKLRLDSFILDMHQRREWFDTMSKSRGKQLRTSAMKIHAAELDFCNADLRAVAANITGTSPEELKRATDESLASHQDTSMNVDMSSFTIPDHDLSWIDMDDFVEMDWILPTAANPETKILPLAFTPRFTYFRQTDHGDTISGDASRESPFGKENTHNCVMKGAHNDPRSVQIRLVKKRLEELEERIKSQYDLMGEHKLNMVRETDSEHMKADEQSFRNQYQRLLDKRVFLQHGLHRLSRREEYPGHRTPSPSLGNDMHQFKDSTGWHDGQNRSSIETTDSVADSNSNNNNNHVDIDGLYATEKDDLATDFNNRFIIHNAQVKWNNSLRNIILRYSHQVSQRRGFVYYMSRRAVKFILDIVDEQSKKKQQQEQETNRSDEHKNGTPSSPAVTPPSDERDNEEVVQERIQQLLKDANKFVEAGDAKEAQSSRPDPNSTTERSNSAEEGSEEKLAENFIAMNGYNMRLIAPQIQLQSEKNEHSVALVTAKGMQLKVISIMDKERLADDVSGLVQRRFSLDMDGVQFFVATLQRVAKYIHLISGNKYGNHPGSSWPPWASIETMFDFHLDPFGFRRVIQKTSASLRYEKYNALRLKHNESVAKSRSGGSRHSSERESGIDHLRVDFPRLRASMDSQQYYTMYIIVLDLLMYSEPLEKVRSERLEKIMLASDFSDLRGIPEMAEGLQERIRQLSELKLQFQLNARYLDRKGWQDRINLDKDLSHCEDELFFIMKAINTSQQRNDERNSQSSGFLRWYLSSSQIVWHLMKDKNTPLLEFQLGNATYERIDNSDGSNDNAAEIEMIRGLNLLPSALYPDIIGPYDDAGNRQNSAELKMLQVQWTMLEAIAGIPVLENFDVNLHPLKVQLEKSLSTALFEYIFPNANDKDSDKGGFSPMMVKNMHPVEYDEAEHQRLKEIVAPEVERRQPDKKEFHDSTPGSIGSRLQPTYNLRKNNIPSSAQVNSGKNKGLGISDHKGIFNRLHRNNESGNKAIQSSNALQRQSSAHSIKSVKSIKRGDSTVSLVVNREPLSRTNSSDQSKSMILRRQNSSTTERTDDNDKANGKGKNKAKKKSREDDVSQMVSRASNYMTYAQFRINSFVICLSYKGQRDRNLIDLHDFVFRMPTLTYENKTWSNLDLMQAAKHDAIKALVSHTPAILGNKLSHHRPGKRQAQKLREIAAGHALIPNSDTLVNTPSIRSEPSVFSDDDSHRMSFQSERTTQSGRRLEPSPLLGTESWGNGVNGRSQTSFGTNGANNGYGSQASPGRQSDGDFQDNFPYSPASPSQIDPLGPISGVLPRPSTAGSFIPGKSLLKDMVGRVNSLTTGSPESKHGGLTRPTIHKGRVRFTSSHNVNGTDGGRAGLERRYSHNDATKLRSTEQNDFARQSNNASGMRSINDTNGVDSTQGDIQHHRSASETGPVPQEEDSPSQRSETGNTPNKKRGVFGSLRRKVVEGFKG